MRELRKRTNGSKICLLGLLPVIYEPLDDISDRKEMNEHLRHLCLDENVQFVDFWKDFAEPTNYRDLFDKRGLHLSSLDDVKLGKLLHELTSNFQRSSSNSNKD